MGRLRRSNSSASGISRRRRGRGFSYAYPDGQPVTDPQTLDRIRRLAIPPAWRNVWICQWPNGHIQAVGTDAAGRRQYRYHNEWRARRDREKFERVLEFARILPTVRQVVERDLAEPGLVRSRVLAAIVRLLDVGLFRIGGEEYAEEHETFGVTSLHKTHVRIEEDLLCFDYPAKGSIERTLEVRDPDAADVLSGLKRRRSGPNLFAYRDGRRWVDVHSNDVNAYIKAAAGDDFSSKDFRTWSATVLAAAALAAAEVPRSPTGRHRALLGAVAEVAKHLGNTPAVCRSSYIDSRVVDRFECGETIADRLDLTPARELLAAGGPPDEASRSAVERAVVEMLSEASGGSAATAA